MATATPYLQPMISIKTANNSAKLAYQGVILWSLSMSLTKISITLSLLRFLKGRLWRVFLYGLIVFIATIWVANTLFVTLQCMPMSAAYDVIAQQAPGGTANGQCVHASVIRAVSNTYSIINIVTDIVLSLLPLEFIIRLQRPVREKALLFVLMAVGIVASAASIEKMMQVQDYGAPGKDFFVTAAKMSTWTVIEEVLAIIAANLPSFKMLFQKGLQRMGVTVTASNKNHGMPAYKNSGQNSSGMYSMGSTRNGGKVGLSQQSTSQEEIYPMKAMDGTQVPVDSIVRTDAISMTSSTYQGRWSDRAAEGDEQFGGRPRRDDVV